MQKQCADCGQFKDTSQFYRRSGKPADGNPINYHPYCKPCHTKRNSKATRTTVWNSSVDGENIVLKEMLKNGIFAHLGKDLEGFGYVDIVAGGCVLTEVKHARARWNYRSDTADFKFLFTPKQIQERLPYHVIVLVCEFTPGQHTFHCFSADHPFFYNDDGSVKPTLRYVVGHVPPRLTKALIPKDLMASTQDAWWVFDVWQQEISRALSEGKRPEYGEPFARDWTPPAVSAKNPVA